MLVHHHLIYQADTTRVLERDQETILKNFLYELVEHLGMEVLIEPQLAFTDGINDAWTGLIGIVTSHISFHYWTKEKYVQLDIYSCKEFNIDETINFLNDFWGGKNIRGLWMNRSTGEEFIIERI